METNTGRRPVSLVCHVLMLNWARFHTHTHTLF